MEHPLNAILSEEVVSPYAGKGSSMLIYDMLMIFLGIGQKKMKQSNLSSHVWS